MLKKASEVLRAPFFLRVSRGKLLCNLAESRAQPWVFDSRWRSTALCLRDCAIGVGAIGGWRDWRWRDWRAIGVGAIGVGAIGVGGLWARLALARLALAGFGRCDAAAWAGGRVLVPAAVGARRRDARESALAFSVCDLVAAAVQSR